MSEEKNEKMSKAELKEKILERLESIEESVTTLSNKIIEANIGTVLTAVISIVVGYFVTVWWTDSWLPSLVSIEFIIATTLIDCCVYLCKFFNSDVAEKFLGEIKDFHEGLDLAVKENIIDADSAKIVVECENLLRKITIIAFPYGLFGALATIVWIIHLIVRWIAS